MSQLFASGGQNIGVSASASTASVLPMNIQIETDMQKNHSNGSIFLLIVLKKDKHFKKLSLNRGRVPSASRTQRKIVFNTFISPDVQTLGPEL